MGTVAAPCITVPAHPYLPQAAVYFGALLLMFFLSHFSMLAGAAECAACGWLVACCQQHGCALHACVPGRRSAAVEQITAQPTAGHRLTSHAAVPSAGGSLGALFLGLATSFAWERGLPRLASLGPSFAFAPQGERLLPHMCKPPRRPVHAGKQ